ncbi:SWIM zinc finger family protein [Dongia deserti]|uniref:SWIM zinc finger family protein n=1 Tax=Dongia deserti TaxID=2268030 RepID=UPI000E658C24|nr:SWIM zinc finger family protein [Dongia deserti]
MALTRGAIEAMAPDQSALAAASKLLQPAKWPARGRSGGLIWGECQGSGANPYRVVADTADPGSKCTCPSRKFPCKHALALMWMFVEDESAFKAGDVPDWVNDWMGRRRKSGGGAAQSGGAKSLDAARAEAAESAPDPEAEVRRKAASEKRAQDTRRSVLAATEELEIWIADQLRTGLTSFLGDLGGRCRRIAARLVDAKANALASRVDEMPSRLLSLSAEERVDAAIQELGKLVLLVRAWRANPDEPELRREVIASETRDDVLANAESLRVTSRWEVLGERIATRRDGLVSQTTWLMNVGPGPQRFAMLLDFFPASAGRRAGAFVAGERFSAELAFYPAKAPLRAVIASRGDPEKASADWPTAGDDPFADHAEQMLVAPWRIDAPLLLPEGRICADAAGRAWWRSNSDMWAPLRDVPPALALGASIESAAGIWDGARLSLIAAQTNWGTLGFDA